MIFRHIINSYVYAIVHRRKIVNLIQTQCVFCYKSLISGTELITWTETVDAIMQFHLPGGKLDNSRLQIYD